MMINNNKNKSQADVAQSSNLDAETSELDTHRRNVACWIDSEINLDS